MKRFVFCVLILSTLVSTTWAGENKTEQPLRIELNLVDGSRVTGIPGIESVPVQTPYAKMDVPLKQIQSVKIGEDHEVASVDLQNGDKIKGTISLGAVKLDTVFGKVSIGIEHIREFRVVLAGGPAATGLLFWNTMESEADVKRGRTGPSGKFIGGKFVEGKFGKGLSVEFTQGVAAVFPADVVSAKKGCMEAWGKLVNVPENMTDGAGPMLFSIQHEKNAILALSFCNNDGASGGGLLGWNNGARSNTGSYGEWSFARALGAGSAQEWHHYALVWDLNGIRGVGDGTKQVAVFLDGRLNSTVWHDKAPPADPNNLKGFELWIMHEQSIRQGSAVLDNLKIWDYPKIDFDDRFRE